MRRIDATGVTMEPLWRPSAVESSEIAPVVGGDPLEAERAAVLEAAYREGHDLGLKRARELFEKESSAWQASRQKEIDELKRHLDATQARFSELIDAIPGQVSRQAEQAESIAIDVAYAALTKLLGDQYQEGAVLRALVHDGIRQAGHTVTAVRVATADAEQLTGLEIPVVSDTRLSLGQCVLETGYGHQACGLDVRLDSLKRAFLMGLARHRDSGKSV